LDQSASARQKTFKLDVSGNNTIGCTDCAWSTTMQGTAILSAEQAFDAHVCAEHPPLKKSAGK
jgi:hypothetical protein